MKKKEFIKYEFSEKEKAEIAREMAEDVQNLKAAEDELKAVRSEYKAQIDSFSAKVNLAATKLSNGYEMRDFECDIEYYPEKKIVKIYRPDTGKLVKERNMTSDEIQKQLPGME